MRAAGKCELDGIKFRVHKVQRASKTDLVVNLLKAPGGASLATLMEATGWQAHSVRGFLSRTRHSGFCICSVRRDGERIYALEPAPEPDDNCTEAPDATD